MKKITNFNIIFLGSTGNYFKENVISVNSSGYALLWDSKEETFLDNLLGDVSKASLVICNGQMIKCRYSYKDSFLCYTEDNGNHNFYFYHE